MHCMMLDNLSKNVLILVNNDIFFDWPLDWIGLVHLTVVSIKHYCKNIFSSLFGVRVRLLAAQTRLK